MMKWIKTGRRVDAEGTTITYKAAGTDIEIESRKRHIPHANGRGGTWDHTTYVALKDGKDFKECYSLSQAKQYVEEAFV